MLYKKYHRNFVRKFKKGTVFKWNGTLSGEIVRKEPYYDNGMIWVIDNEYGKWDLVYYNGRINKHLYVV